MRRKPDHVPIGYAVKLVSVRGLAKGLGVTEPEALQLLDGLKVPRVEVGPEDPGFFNLHTLEFILVQLLRPAGKGYHWGTCVDSVRNLWFRCKFREEFEWLQLRYKDLDVGAMRERLSDLVAGLKETRLVRRTDARD